MKSLIVFALLSVAISAPAGTWTCDTGLDGKQIYQTILKGDANGNMQSPASVSVAGMPAGRSLVYPDQAGPGELARVVIGAEVAQKKSILRIMAAAVAPNVYPAYSLYVNFPIKREFEGTCTFVP